MTNIIMHGMKKEPSDEKMRNLLLKKPHCWEIRGYLSTSDLFTPLKWRKENAIAEKKLFFFFGVVIFHIYLTIGSAIKNDVNHTITMMIVTRWGLLCRAYFNGCDTAM